MTIWPVTVTITVTISSRSHHSDGDGDGDGIISVASLASPSSVQCSAVQCTLCSVQCELYTAQFALNTASAGASVLVSKCHSVIVSSRLSANAKQVVINN